MGWLTRLEERVGSAHWVGSDHWVGSAHRVGSAHWVGSDHWVGSANWIWSTKVLSAVLISRTLQIKVSNYQIETLVRFR